MQTPPDIQKNIIIPTLTKLGLYTLTAEKLLMGTAAVESRFAFRRQFNGGPALGLFQMEPATFNWLMTGFLASKKHVNLKKTVLQIAGKDKPIPSDLVINDAFAAAMARVRYYAVSAPLPSALKDQAFYWWRHYNGESPHGLKPADYLERWNKLCAPLYGISHDYSPPDSFNAPESVKPLLRPIWV